jgi:O-antigen/teichoic acid export membrane protein
MLLPVTAYMLVVGQAFQGLSQRSGNFYSSGLSEVVNRAGNSITAIAVGFFHPLGPVLGGAASFGLMLKGLFLADLRIFVRHPARNTIVAGLDAVRRLSLSRTLGGLAFSHGVLAVTMLLPLTFVSYQYSQSVVGQLTLVFSTLALPISLVGNAVGQVFYQRAAALISNHENFRSVLLRTFWYLSLGSLPFFFLFSMVSQTLYPLLFGDDWRLAGDMARIFCIASFFCFVSVPFERSAIVVNAWWWGPIWHVFRLTSVISTIVVCRNYDLEVIAFLYLFTVQQSFLYLVDFLASLYFSGRHSRYE